MGKRWKGGGGGGRGEWRVGGLTDPLIIRYVLGLFYRKVNTVSS